MLQLELFARIAPETGSDRRRFDEGLASSITGRAVQEVWPEAGPNEPMIGVVGRLPFEALRHRMSDDYGVDTRLTRLPCGCSAWIEADEDTFQAQTNSMLARDARARRAPLFRSELDRRFTEQRDPDHVLWSFA